MISILAYHLQEQAYGGLHTTIGLFLLVGLQDPDDQVAAQLSVSGFGEQFLPQSPQFGLRQARQFLDFGADFCGHANYPVRMTLPLCKHWKSSETETIAAARFRLSPRN